MHHTGEVFKIIADDGQLRHRRQTQRCLWCPCNLGGRVSSGCQLGRIARGRHARQVRCRHGFITLQWDHRYLA